MSTVLTSNPSTAKKPKSSATKSGNVPLNVGVLEAKLTIFDAASAAGQIETPVQKASRAQKYLFISPMLQYSKSSYSPRVLSANRSSTLDFWLVSPCS